MRPSVLFAFASWEDRFPLGIERSCNENQLARVVIYYTVESEAYTLPNRQHVEDFCRRHGIPHKEISIQFNDPPATWRQLRSHLLNSDFQSEPALVDISTMPRDIIWTVLLFLREAGTPAAYVYHKPAEYDGEWLSRDPARPRLVYKLAGISEFDRPTVLLITTGFDVDRTQMLINRFEPRHTLLAVQEGGQFNNRSLNIETHRERFPDGEFTTLFELDTYSSDHGLAQLLGKVQPFLNDFNIIASSLGPKPSAISLFKLAMMHPKVALAYAPAKEYNKSYSRGIGETYRGHLATS